MIVTARPRYRLSPFVPHDPVVRAYRSPGIISAAQPGGPVLPVTFPTAPLNNRVMIALTPDPSLPYWQWGWADITQYVRHADGISLTYARQDEATAVDTQSGALTLDNSDGRFSRRNPYSPYYGFLTKNTPIWCQVDPGSGFVTRLKGFVNEWPSRWDISRNDVTVPIKTAGILRRLRNGKVFKSPLRRSVTFTDPTCYWALEDGADASQGAALAGGSPMLIAGTVEFGGNTTVPAGSTGVVSFAGGGILQASTGLTQGAASTWELEFTASLDAIPTATSLNIWTVATIDTPGSDYPRCGVGITGDTASGPFYWTGFWITSSGSMGANSSTARGPIVLGQSYRIIVHFFQSGSAWSFVMFLDDAVDSYTSGSQSPHTLYNPTAVTLNGPATPVIGADNVSLSHVGIWVPGRLDVEAHFELHGDDQNTAKASIGWVGEQAHVRVARICAEEHIPFTATGSSSMAMGPQPLGTALQIFRECEEADMGSLYESGFGLGFQCHRERDNAAVAMTLDMNLGHVSDPPEPADDDQRLTNRFTASRSNGSEATYEKADGPMGTAVGGPGLFDDSKTFNMAADSDLLPRASAQVLHGTVDEDRWPLVTSDLAATPDLIPNWAALPFGARINITHPPSQMAPDTIDAIVEGWTERWTPLDWDIELNTTPASPHHVFVLAETTGDLNPFKGYLTPASCALAAELDTTSVSVTVTSSTLWSTAADDWTPPPTITIEGEDMTVSAVAGSGNPQTLTVARSANGVVKAHAAGVAVAFKSPGVLGL